MAMLNNQMVYKMVFISATLPDTNGDGIYNQHISLSNGIVESKGQLFVRWFVGPAVLRPELCQRLDQRLDHDYHDSCRILTTSVIKQIPVWLILMHTDDIRGNMSTIQPPKKGSYVHLPKKLWDLTSKIRPILRDIHKDTVVAKSCTTKRMVETL